MIPPAQMGAQVNEDGIPQTTGVPKECSWEDFGICATHAELRWGRDKCEKFARKSVLEARKSRKAIVQLRKGRTATIGGP
jgi:hypothetical protein